MSIGGPRQGERRGGNAKNLHVVPSDNDAVSPALPVGAVENVVVVVEGAGNDRSLEVVDDITAHKPGRHSYEETVRNEREEIASCQDRVGGLVEGSMGLIGHLVDQLFVFFGQACGDALGEDETSLLFGLRKEGRDEKTPLVEKEDDFELLHEGEEFADVGALKDLAKVLHQHEPWSAKYEGERG